MANSPSFITRMRSRRTLAMAATLVAVAVTALAVESVNRRLGKASMATGWALLTSTGALYLLSLRKRLIGRSLGPVAVWLQIHIYTGSFALVVFFMHVGWPMRGWFESMLGTCFLFVSTSGVWLSFLSRSVPRKLAAVKLDYRFEDIPALQAKVAREAQALALSSVRLNEGATLSEYYQTRLLPFFHEQRSWFYRLLPNGSMRRQLHRELSDLDRYLADAGQEERKKLSDLVQSKDDLDFHSATQSRLRNFFTLHVALVWGLALLVAVHVILVHRFQGFAL